MYILYIMSLSCVVHYDTTIYYTLTSIVFFIACMHFIQSCLLLLQY